MEKTSETVCPASRQHWREWLRAHHAQQQSVGLVYYKKSANQPTLTWSEAVDEALCFGWIDSRAEPLDGERYRQFFSRRKPRSTWSKVNKNKVARLLHAGLLAPAGLACIEVAKHNGSWSLLDEVEELHLPADLALAFQANPVASSYFADLCRSDKRSLLQWLVLARRPTTRQHRIAELVAQASQHQKPRPFRSRPRRT